VGFDVFEICAVDFEALFVFEVVGVGFAVELGP